MRIAGAYLRDFEPFADQSVEFPRKDQQDLAEVHFLVGQNGTGKTRLLTLLAAACGNPGELRYRAVKCCSTVIGMRISKGVEELCRFSRAKNAIVCESGTLTDLFSKIADEPLKDSFRITVGESKDLIGMAFQSIPFLEDKPVGPLHEIVLPSQLDFLKFDHHTTENLIICQGLTNLKIRKGIVSHDRKDRTVRMVNALDEAIRSITGRNDTITLNYVGNTLHLKVSWDGKEIQLKQLPDGMRSIMGWLASCVVKLDLLHPDNESPLEQPLILLLDEPDTHLHPAWQRKLIPAVQKLLPNAQIFVATHSPFVISSVNHGWIHVFEANDKGIVTIKAAQPCGLGDSYIEVVEDILGVREQFDPETEEKLKEFRKKRDTAKKLPRDEAAITEVKTLANEIAKRGEALNFMMGREIAQLEAQLNIAKI